MSFDHWKIDRMLSKNIEASGLNVFYGEAGREDAPNWCSCTASLPIVVEP